MVLHRLLSYIRYCSEIVELSVSRLTLLVVRPAPLSRCRNVERVVHTQGLGAGSLVGRNNYDHGVKRWVAEGWNACLASSKRR